MKRSLCGLFELHHALEVKVIWLATKFSIVLVELCRVLLTERYVVLQQELGELD